MCERFFWAVISETLFLLKVVGSLLFPISDLDFFLYKQIFILWTHNDTFLCVSTAMTCKTFWLVEESSTIFLNLHIFYIHDLSFWDSFLFYILVHRIMYLLIIGKAVYRLISPSTSSCYFIFYIKHTLLSFYMDYWAGLEDTIKST